MKSEMAELWRYTVTQARWDMADGWIAFGAAVVGATVGPLVAAWFGDHSRHLSSLRTVDAEIAANITNLSVSLQVWSDEPNDDVLAELPLKLAPQRIAFDAVARDLATWEASTARHVFIFYMAIEALARLSEMHTAALQATHERSQRADRAAPLTLARGAFAGVRSVATQALDHGSVAREWIRSELASEF